MKKWFSTFSISLLAFGINAQAELAVGGGVKGAEPGESAQLMPQMDSHGKAILPEKEWSFEGFPSEDWDKEKILRGYAVATQVCLACHSFKYISHRDMMKLGFSEEEAKNMAESLGFTLDDKMMSSLDDASAAEIYGKPLPDLSVMNKARPGGANYVYALLTGYADGVPLAFREKFVNGLPSGSYFNFYFPSHAIAMPPPLSEGLVSYHDETEATVPQMAKDVAYFMQWTAEPELLDRKRLGIYVLIYLVIFAGLAYATKRMVWKRLK